MLLKDLSQFSLTNDLQICSYTESLHGVLDILGDHLQTSGKSRNHDIETWIQHVISNDVEGFGGKILTEMGEATDQGILQRFFKDTYTDFEDYFAFRKEFTRQFAIES